MSTSSDPKCEAIVRRILSRLDRIERKIDDLINEERTIAPRPINVPQDFTERSLRDPGVGKVGQQ